MEIIISNIDARSVTFPPNQMVENHGGTVHVCDGVPNVGNVVQQFVYIVNDICWYVYNIVIIILRFFVLEMNVR